MDPMKDERLTAYVDGELSEEEAYKLEDDMEKFPEMREFMAELRLVREQMKRLGAETKAPRGFAGRVMDGVDGQVWAANRRPPWWKPILAPMGSMLLAATALFVLYANLPEISDQMVGAPPEGTPTASAPSAPALAPAPREQTEAGAPQAAEPAPVAPPSAKPSPGMKGSAPAAQAKEASNGQPVGPMGLPYYMAPDGYRFRGAGAWEAVVKAAKAEGGRLLDEKGAEVTAAPPEGQKVILEIPAEKVSRFRHAIGEGVIIDAIGMGRVIEGTVKLPIYIAP